MRVAYFDLDKTLLSVNTADLWFRKLRREKRITWNQMAKGAYWMLQYRLGRAEVETQITKAFQGLAGYPFEQLQQEFLSLFTERIRHLYRPGAVKALAMHRKEMHRVFLLSSAPNFIADIISRDLELDDCLCTRLETSSDGKFTGKVIGPLCYGQGKVTAASEHARKMGYSLSDSYFYTDSITDVPMLEAVGTPVVINPDMRLMRFAKKRRWPIEDWGQAHDR